MDAYCDRSYPGWEEGLAAAEGEKQLVFLPTGQPVYAVLVNDLVRLRALPGQAKKGQQS